MQAFSQRRKITLSLLLVFFLITVATILLMFGKEQDIRQHASETQDGYAKRSLTERSSLSDRSDADWNKDKRTNNIVISPSRASKLTQISMTKNQKRDNRLTPTRTPSLSPTMAPTNTQKPSVTPITTIPTKTPTPTIAPTNTPAPSPTPISQNTSLALNLLLHAVGNGGDSQAPGTPGNFIPLNPQRSVTVTILDSSGASVTSKQGLVDFNPTLGNFTGLISLDTRLPIGNYSVKFKSPRYLQKQALGFFSITTTSQTVPVLLPQTTLIVGDSNNDNAIDILDYTMLTDCFSVLLQPKFCSDPQKKTAADLNDDDKVDGTDLNIFLRNVHTQTGN